MNISRITSLDFLLSGSCHVAVGMWPEHMNIVLFQWLIANYRTYKDGGKNSQQNNSRLNFNSFRSCVYLIMCGTRFDVAYTLCNFWGIWGGRELLPAAVQIRVPDRVSGIVRDPAFITARVVLINTRDIASKEESELRLCHSEQSCDEVTVRNTAYAGNESRNILMKTHWHACLDNVCEGYVGSETLHIHDAITKQNCRTASSLG